MEQLKAIVLGMVLGVGFTYAWLGKTSNPETVTMIKEKESSQHQKVIAQNKLYSKEKEPIQDKEDIDDREKDSIREPMKTPDELYAEAHKENYEKWYTAESEESIPEDRTVVSEEQVQAEREIITTNTPMIDRTLIPKELEEAESIESSAIDKAYNQESVLPLEPEIKEKEDLKEVIPETLSILEEYDNDESYVEEGESEIPL